MTNVAEVEGDHCWKRMECNFDRRDVYLRKQLFRIDPSSSGADCTLVDASFELEDAITNTSSHGVTAKALTMGPSFVFLLLVEQLIRSNSPQQCRPLTSMAPHSGGWDATESDSIKLMIDRDYLYVCTAPTRSLEQTGVGSPLGAAY